MKLSFSFLLSFISVLTFGQNLQYSWHSQLNGFNVQFIQGLVLLPDSSVIAWGLFGDVVDFNPEEKDYMLSSSEGRTFIVKYTADGKFVWAVNLDTVGHLNIHKIKTDFIGDIYIYGTFNYSVDFDPSPDSLILSDSLGHTVFAKYSGTDGQFIFARQINTTFNSYFNEDLAVDQNKNIFLSGYLNDTADFDPGPGIMNIIPSNPGNSFIAKFDSQGNFVDIGLYDWQISSKAIVCDASNNLYISGVAFGSSDVDFSNGIHNINDKSIFIAKYDNNLNFLKVAEFVSSGSSSSQTFKISLNSNNELFFTGSYYNGSIDFDASANSANLQTSTTSHHEFFTRQDTGLNYLSAFLIPTHNSSNQMGFTCMSTAIDSYNNIYAIGTVKYTYDADPGSGTFIYNTLDPTCLMIKYDVNGNYLTSYLIEGNAAHGWDHIISGRNNRVYAGINYQDRIDLIDGPDSLYLPYLWDSGTSFDRFDASIVSFIQCTPDYTNLNLTICSGDSVLIGSESFNTPGTYERRLTSSTDCDSIITLTLQVNNVDLNICTSGNTLVSNQDSATYRWLNCITQQVVSTSQSFNIPDNDGYSVEITKGGCIDSTECFQIFSRANEKIPSFSWASPLPFEGFWGATSHIEIDHKGNLIIGMSIRDTANIDLTGNNNYYLDAHGSTCMAIAKYDQNRNVLWSFRLGRLGGGNWSSGGEEIHKMCLDDDGNIYVVGTNTEDFDIDPGPGVYILPRNQTPCGSVFVAKFSSGGQFVWAKWLNTCHGVYCLFTNHTGSVFVGGVNTMSSSKQWFLKELDCLNGNEIWYYSPTNSSFLNETNLVWSGVCDSQNNIIFTGSISGTMDFDPDSSTTYNVSSGTSHYKQYIAKYDVNHQFISAGFVNNLSVYSPYGCQVKLACDDELFITNNGTYNSSIFNGNGNFICFLKNALISDIEIKNSDIYVAFNFSDSCIIGTDTFYSPGDEQMGLAKYSTDGDYAWAFVLGSMGNDYSEEIAVDQHESIYLNGICSGIMDVDPGPSLFEINGSIGNNQEFISVYNQSCGPVDTSLTTDSLRISVIDDRAYYVWIDCSTGLPLPGAHSATIPDYASGYFKVIIYEGQCIDSSACHFASPTLGIEDQSNLYVKIFPNPVSDHITFVSNENLCFIELISLQSSSLFYKEIPYTMSVEIPLPSLISGVYLVKMVTCKGLISWKRIVVVN